MSRKPSRRREPTPKQEGEQIIEQAAKAGAEYAQDQVASTHFRDWVDEQLAEAERMRQADPASVFPSDTPEGARKAARNMLQQLEWDTERELETSEVMELSGAKGVFGSGSDAHVRDTYGITREAVTGAFFEAFKEELRAPNNRQWLTEIILEASGERRGVGERRRAVRGRVARDSGDQLSDTELRALFAVNGRLHMTPGEKDAAYDVLIPGGYIDASGTWKVTQKGLAALRGYDNRTGRRRRLGAREYVSVDTRNRVIAGPFTDYGEAKRAADKQGGHVRFVMDRGDRPRSLRERPRVAARTVAARTGPRPPPGSRPISRR